MIIAFDWPQFNSIQHYFSGSAVTFLHIYCIKCYHLLFRGQSEQILSQVNDEQKSDESTKDEVFVKEYKCSYNQDDSLQDTKPAEMSLSVLDRMASGNWREVWNPRMSMSLTSTKGLLNPAGQNNCFLNSAVQVSGVSMSFSKMYP